MAMGGIPDLSTWHSVLAGSCIRCAMAAVCHLARPWRVHAARQHAHSWEAWLQVVDLFKLLGRALAKALQDNRLLDLPLSYVFYRYLPAVAHGYICSTMAAQRSSVVLSWLYRPPTWREACLA